MEKMKMHTLDITESNIERIGKLFPNCLTERISENGKVETAIDFDQLRQELSKDIVEGPQERYQFTWPNKRNAIRLASSPSTMTLRPCKDKSISFEQTKNVYIEGDNLEVLKLLRETYLGKVDCIYIDPPYNTGKDFVYKDDFSVSSQLFQGLSGSVDLEGNTLLDKFEQNLSSNGRFHTDWLNMIYPRLKVARDLMAPQGIIFISIDDNEVENLRKVCDEIFDKKNMIACFCWKTDGNFDNQAKVKICHEYILAYAKHAELFPTPLVIDPSIPSNSKLFREEIRNTIIKNGPKNPISTVMIPVGFPCDFEKGIIHKDDVVWPKYDVDIIVESGKTCNEVNATTGWASKAQLVDFIRTGYSLVEDSKGQLASFVMTKTGAIESIKKREKPSHVISMLQGLGGAQKASIDLGDLSPYFDYPKPVALIKYLCSMINSKNATFMDFFSGSATTAAAIMELNLADHGARSYILVQLPESIHDSKYETICDVGEARIYQCVERLKATLREGQNSLFDQNEDWEPDLGVRVFRLDSSNMSDVYYRPEEFNEQLIKEDNVKGDRIPEDLLFQVMLECNLPLSSSVKSEEIAGKEIYSVNDGYLIACFDEDVNEEVITSVAKRKPYYFVMRDSSLSSDNVADNFEQIFQAYSKETIRRIL